jgi:hypothetical protein
MPLALALPRIAMSTGRNRERPRGVNRVEVATMRMLRAAVAFLVVLAGVLVGAPPAYAGNWMVAVLDPVADRFEAGRAYTIGFWALQHGSHPFEGKLESIGIKLVAENGTPLMYSATALPEPAHYATTIHVAASGTYSVYSFHEPFQNYRIGTLTVPGGLDVLAIPTPLPIDPSRLPWGEIRPPTVPVDAERNPFEDSVAVPAQQPTGAPATAARPASDEGSPTPTLLAILAATALLLGLFLVHRRRRVPAPAVAADRLDMRVGTPEEPVDAEPDPVEISSRS